MNLLHLFTHLLSGILAGYASWATFGGGMPWSFGTGFLTTLLSTGVFSACYMGLSFSLLSLGNEMLYNKAIRHFSTGAAIGLAVPMLSTVVFSLLFDVFGFGMLFPNFAVRFFWWFFLAASLSCARGIAIGNSRGGFYGFIGLTPGIVLMGILMDRFFAPRELWFVGSLLFGGVSGFCQGIGLEMLKEAWLEESTSSYFQPQFILETDEFSAGSNESFDLTIVGGPENYFIISEKDGIHFLEVMDENPITIAGRGHFRFRALLDGDALEVDNRTWIYHSRLIRTRDAIPEAAG